MVAAIGLGVGVHIKKIRRRPGLARIAGSAPRTDAAIPVTTGPLRPRIVGVVEMGSMWVVRMVRVVRVVAMGMVVVLQIEDCKTSAEM